MSFAEVLWLMEISIRHAGGYVDLFEPGIISRPLGSIRGRPFSLFFYFILFYFFFEFGFPLQRPGTSNLQNPGILRF
jgi:hypothetical protein